ncbi:hypothetical protein Cfor_04742 [Coptotermes formosanus]|uniref:Uncharacterized protein n=1 Tax=Coptotermes formosanus TaxID=36987 RepID=A0A6L2PJV4_COPFO|nr:hypothetical protein Cfor_04742 [Coptotermes formosanus]
MTTVFRNIVKETCKSAVRNIGTRDVRHSSFEVQDPKDFQEREKNHKSQSS